LVVELPRLPGARENRWSQLLSGQPAIESQVGSRAAVAAGPESDELRSRVESLEAEVAALRKMVERLPG
jgi:hypothetical protein